MNFGFNSNVHTHGAVYHVQTEDRGPSHPFLDTVVYETGRVVYKRSTSYQDFAAASSKEIDFPEQLHERLAQQHREVISQLEAGILELSGTAKSQTKTPAATPTAAPSLARTDTLDLRLMNPKTWLSAGSIDRHVTLEIELRRQSSQQSVAGAQVEALLEHEKDRTRCMMAQTDGNGKATLKFAMPPVAANGSSLVIRVTDGHIYGELRFLLKATRQSAPNPVPVLK